MAPNGLNLPQVSFSYTARIDEGQISAGLLNLSDTALRVKIPALL